VFERYVLMVYKRILAKRLACVRVICAIKKLLTHFCNTLFLCCWILLLFSFLVRFDLQLCETFIVFLAFNELTFSLCFIWTATAACATVLFDLFLPVGA